MYGMGLSGCTGGGGDFDPPSLISNTLTQDQVNGDRFTNNSFTSTLNNTGGDATDCLMTATVTGALAIEAGTQPITTNNYPGTSSTEVELTLAGTGNLGGGVFEVDDEVKANADYTPETDQIDNVSLVKAWNQDQEWSTYISWDPFEGSFVKVFDAGKAYPNGMITGANKKLVEMSNFGIPVTSVVTLTCRTTDTYTKDSTTKVIVNVGGTNISYANTSINPTREEDGVGYWDIPVSPGILQEVHVQGNSGVGRTYLGGIEVDGIKLVDAGITGDPGAGNTLTLSTEKDIQLFQAGDVVQQNIYQSQEWSSTEFCTRGSIGTSGYNSIRGFVNQDRGEQIWYAPTNSTGSRFETGDLFNDAKTIEIGYSKNGSGSLNVNGVEITTTNTLTGTAIVSLENGFQYLEFFYPTAGNYFGIHFIIIDGQQLIDLSRGDPGIVKVTATDVSAKTITVDGGTWDTSNQSEVWSNVYKTGNFDANNPPTNSFNGVIEALNFSTGALGETAGFDFTSMPAGGISYNSSIKIYVFRNQSANALFINGQEITAITQLADKVQTFVIDADNPMPGGSSVLETIVSNREDTTSSAVGVIGIEVDGKILIDAVNDSQVWSTYLTSSTNDFSQPREKAFDGKYGSSGDRTSVPKGSKIIFTPPEALSVKKFEIWTGSSGDECRYKINSESFSNWIDVSNGSSGGSYWVTVFDFENPVLLNEFELRDPSSTGNIFLAAVKFDGKVLIDTGVHNLGDSKVSTVSPKQGTGTISEINGTAVTITPFTDNCFKETQHLVHVTPKPVLVNPKTDTISTIIGDVLTFTTDKDLYQFANGDPVSMCNADGTPATVEIETDTIQKVEDGVFERTNTPGPAYTGSFNSSYPNYDLFTQRYVNAYNATSDGGSMYEVGYFSSIGPATLISDMDINPGIELKPGDTVDVYLYPYSFTTTLYFNGIDVGSTDGSNYVTKGDSFRVDLTAFFAAGETTITNATFSVPGGGSRQAGWLGFEVNGNLDYLSKKILTLQGTTNLNQFNPGDVVADPFVVIDKDEAVPSIDVSGGFWYGADGSGNPGASTKVTQNKIPAGTVDSVNVNTNAMLLKTDGSNNGLWVNGYYVATPEKLASSTKGYVRFDSDGQVECIESYPLPATNMQNKDAPKLRFPDKFECVDAAPDSELGASTYLQTEVQLKSLFGDSAVKKSNALIPQTSTYTVAANTASLNTTEYVESAAKIKTQSERAAQMRVDNAQQSLEDWKSDFTDEANNYSI